MNTTQLICFTGLLAASAGAFAQSGLPDSIKVPDGHKVALETTGVGEITYECRDKPNAAGQTVNRTTALASVGSAALDNEECWIYQAMLRSLGLVYIEHQARI